MLEVVATMPSSPILVGVLVKLDIGSRSVRLIRLPSHAKGVRGVQLSFIRQKTLAFQTAGITSVYREDTPSRRVQCPLNGWPAACSGDPRCPHAPRRTL